MILLTNKLDELHESIGRIHESNQPKQNALVFLCYTIYHMPENLQKFIAQSGLCSRRRAETLIRNKRVRINRNIAVVTDRVHEGDVVTVGQMVEVIYIVVGGKENLDTNGKINFLVNKGYMSASTDINSNATFSNLQNIFDNPAVSMLIAETYIPPAERAPAPGADAPNPSSENPSENAPPASPI